MVASQTVRAFMDALREIEATRRAGPMGGLFTEDAALQAPSRTPEVSDAAAPGGAAAHAERFWERYLAAFSEVRSTFTRVLEGDGFAVLEWESRGTLPGGRPVRYEGVSIIEHDDNRIRAFRTYYDSAAFLQAAQERADVPHRPDHRPARDDSTGGRRGPVPLDNEAADTGRTGGTGGRKGHRPPRSRGESGRAVE